MKSAHPWHKCRSPFIEEREHHITLNYLGSFGIHSVISLFHESSIAWPCQWPNTSVSRFQNLLRELRQYLPVCCTQSLHIQISSRAIQPLVSTMSHHLCQSQSPCYAEFSNTEILPPLNRPQSSSYQSLPTLGSGFCSPTGSLLLTSLFQFIGLFLPVQYSAKLSAILDNHILGKGSSCLAFGKVQNR